MKRFQIYSIAVFPRGEGWLAIHRSNTVRNFRSKRFACFKTSRRCRTKWSNRYEFSDSALYDIFRWKAFNCDTIRELAGRWVYVERGEREGEPVVHCEKHETIESHFWKLSKTDFFEVIVSLLRGRGSWEYNFDFNDVNCRPSAISYLTARQIQHCRDWFLEFEIDLGSFEVISA